MQQQSPIDEEHRIKLDETVRAIDAGTNTLNDFCTDLRFAHYSKHFFVNVVVMFRAGIVSRDAQSRRAALNELSYAILHLNEQTLQDAEGVRASVTYSSL